MSVMSEALPPKTVFGVYLTRVATLLMMPQEEIQYSISAMAGFVMKPPIANLLP